MNFRRFLLVKILKKFIFPFFELKIKVNRNFLWKQN